mgnify:CR=1 FL=1
MTFYKPNFKKITDAFKDIKESVTQFLPEEEQEESNIPDTKVNKSEVVVGNITPPQDPGPKKPPIGTVDLGKKISDLTKTDYETKSGMPTSTGVGGKQIDLPIPEEQLIVSKEDTVPMFIDTEIADFLSKLKPVEYEALLCNDGTLTNNDTEPQAWDQAYNILIKPVGLASYLNAITSQYVNEGAYQTSDLARLLAGATWTTYSSLNQKDVSGVKFGFLRNQIQKQSGTDSTVKQSFLQIKKDTNATWPEHEDPFQAAPLYADNFGQAYESTQGFNTPLFSRIKSLSLAPGLATDTIEGDDVSYFAATNSSAKKNSPNTGVRERIIMRTPMRASGLSGMLESDKNVLTTLRQIVTPTIQQFGANNPIITDIKTFYDYVCKYETPKSQDFSNLKPTPGRDLYVDSESVYKYYEQTYEEFIKSETVSENTLPDYNINTMHDKWSPLQQLLVGNFQEFESLVNNSDFDDYYNYATLEGIIDPLSILNQAAALSDKFKSQNYFREWTKGAQFVGDNFQNFPVFNKADDLIFPAKSAIIDTIEKDPFGGQYPMHNRITLKMPPPSYLKRKNAITEEFDLRALMGGLPDKFAGPPLDHAYLTRILKHIESANSGDETIAYPPIKASAGVFITKDKGYWEDYVTDKWWLATPERTTEKNYSFSVSSLNQPSLQFLEFLTNLARYENKLYGYAPGKEEDKTYLSLLKSNNRNAEESLQVIENKNNENYLRATLKSLNKVFQCTRTFSEILEGKLAPSQIIGFRIKKYKADALGTKAAKPISTFFISNTNNQEDIKDRIFDFFDTRVKYGERYVYDINALHFVVGTKYMYKSVTEPRLLATKNKSFYEMQAIVDSFPHVKIVEVPYETDIPLLVMDKPPLAPEVEPVPFKNVDNKLLWLLRPQLGDAEEIPIILLDSDQDMLRKQYQAQYGGILGQGLEEIPGGLGGDLAKALALALQKEAGFAEPGISTLKYRGDDLTKRYQVFRLSTPPKSYSDFSNAELIREVGSDFSTSTSFKDDLKPNQKYYYIFRSIDVHNNLSNPTPIYEVELINDSGTVYIETKIYEFPKPDKVSSKPVKRFISIEPAFAQRILNEDSSGILGADQDTYITTGKSKDLKLGVLDQSVFGGNKRIKVRLTSKQTNRKIDFNVDFAVKNTVTEESKNPDKWGKNKIVLPPIGPIDVPVFGPVDVFPEPQSTEDPDECS